MNGPQRFQVFGSIRHKADQFSQLLEGISSVPSLLTRANASWGMPLKTIGVQSIVT
jgi:hypothetical protein